MKGLLILIIIIISFFAVSCNKDSKKEVLSKDVSSEVQVEVSESQQFLSKGKEALKEEDYNNAKVYYEKALSLDKSNKELYLQIKDDYLAKKRYEDAYEVINKAISNNIDVDNMENILDEIKVHFPVIEIVEEIEEGEEYYPPYSTIGQVNGEQIKMNIIWDKKIPSTLASGEYSYLGYSTKYGRTIKLSINVTPKEAKEQATALPEVQTSNSIDSDNNNPAGNDGSNIANNIAEGEATTNPSDVIPSDGESDKKDDDLNVEVPLDIDKNYSIEKCYINDASVSVAYPEVRSMANEELQRSINEKLFSKAEEIANYYQGGNPTMQIDYTIKSEGNILSLVYTGIGSSEGSAYPLNFFFTSNINMNTGELLGLSDLTTIDGGFISKLRAAETVGNSSIENYFNTLSDEEIMTKLNSSDTTGSEVQSYLTTEGKIGVSIQVIHAMGDHLEYEVLQ